jgi:hypothetical protein
MAKAEEMRIRVAVKVVELAVEVRTKIVEMRMRVMAKVVVLMVLRVRLWPRWSKRGCMS